jgi:hypothetical protein
MKTVKLANVAKTAVLAAVAAALALGLSSPADAAAGTMYGDPAAAAKWWRHQQYDDCAIMSSADVIGQMTGKEPSERSIIKKAQSTPSPNHPGSIYIKPADLKNPNSGHGTAWPDVLTLLKQYGVDAEISNKDHPPKTDIPVGIEGVEQLLAGGHAVIVGVNAEMIWGKPVMSKDDQGNPVSDHAVVLTGIDTANNVVHLNDSGDPKGRDEQIPLELFMKSWDTSGELVIVTTGTIKK